MTSRDRAPWETGTGCGPEGRNVRTRDYEAAWRARHPLRPTLRTVATAAQAQRMRALGHELRVKKVAQ